ncbi:hypothetical protein Golax_019332 [Gossypium laxum]|uniref:Uncharacterized protein n=1 Tax=Gossypium laxum TaxID=34288 RepID=A0A7J8Z6R2_9ROSI|nr:hypothetical protein [Gossypium laxum]
MARGVEATIWCVANEMSRVPSLGIWAIWTRVTVDPFGFDVFLKLLNPEKKKSSALASFGYARLLRQSRPYKIQLIVIVKLSRWAGSICCFLFKCKILHFLVIHYNMMLAYMFDLIM